LWPAEPIKLLNRILPIYPMDVQVSVVIPAYNEEDVIEGCLRSILETNRKDMEVVVVDDGSRDRTAEIVGSIRDRRLKLIELEKNSGAARARNVGIDNAKGKYILFTDADCTVSKGWIGEHLKSLKRYDCVVGSSRPINADDSPVSNVFYYMAMERWNKSDGVIVSAATANGSFRSDIFGKVRFDEDFRTAAYEDQDFMIRVEEAGFRCGYNPDAEICHIFHETFRGQLRRVFLLSDAFNVFIRKHRTAKRTAMQITSIAVTLVFPLLVPFALLMTLRDIRYIFRAAKRAGMRQLPFLVLFESSKNAVQAVGITYHLARPRWRR
jgi:glycosyltransferase involved in cell wall biosynthesis